MGTGDAQHPMTETFHQLFELAGNKGLVLDDQHIGGDFGGKLAARFLDEPTQRHHIDIENACGIALRETFQRDQQERLARSRCDAGKLLLAWE